MKLSRAQLILNAVSCIILLGVVVWAFYGEYNRPWNRYQKEKIQQIWLKDLGVADRCNTCHAGIDRPDSVNRPQPLKTHSGDYLKHHKMEKFGCVVCHQGQGEALTLKTAHGRVNNWTKPLLKGYYAQSSCGKCHSLEMKLPLSANLAGAEKFFEGWKIFREYNCTGCHKLKKYERPVRIGPALSSISKKVSRKWLIGWLKNPKDYLPDAKMPAFKLSDEKIGYIADYLMSLKSPHPPFAKESQSIVINPLLIERKIPPLKKRDAGGFLSEGKTLVSSFGCLGCHLIHKKGGSFAPEFSFIGDKVKPEWLFYFLKKPRSYDAKTTMPEFNMSDGEIRSIAAYLSGLKKQINIKNNPPLSIADKRGAEGLDDIAKGKKLVKDLGCTGCHEIEKFPLGYDAPALDGIGDKRVDELFFGNITDTEKTLINWLLVKVIDPGRFATDKVIMRMPYYNFDRNQSEALVTFLLSVRNNSLPVYYTKILIDSDSAEIRGKSVIERYNCLGCHRINGNGGNIGPDLTREAKKSRQEWLFKFLKKTYKIRPAPMLEAGMPDFNLSDTEVNAIIEYFAFISGESYPYKFEAKKETPPENIYDGEKLYHEVFACGGCHAVDGRGGEVGPEHTDAASRLKREWIEQWLKNPQAVQPDMRMPRFKFKDWEFEALTDYLMTLGKYRFLRMKNRE
ncbi:MAG: c-type cytochrome [Nitrospirae bacterium]|nr:c-type cytochrome [Nitrospirota bacterium]